MTSDRKMCVNLIRLSIGLEAVADLIAMKSGLAAVEARPSPGDP